jgi:dimethylaniline monooxygenase (N-oxide forming)
MGFMRPGVGAIPPLAEMQAMLWVGIISGKVNMPPPLVQKPLAGEFANGKLDSNEAYEVMHGIDELQKADYHLLQNKMSRIQYGVDHGA